MPVPCRPLTCPMAAGEGTAPQSPLTGFWSAAYGGTPVPGHLGAAHPPDRCVHPVKIGDELALDETLLAVVVPADGGEYGIPSRYQSRVRQLPADRPAPDAWASLAAAVVTDGLW